MTKEDFEKLLKRYRAGECTPDEVAQIDRWFAVIADEDKSISFSEKNEIDSRMRQQLSAALPSSRSTDHSFFHPLLKIAASIAFLVIGYLVADRLYFHSTDVFSSIPDVVDKGDKVKIVNASENILHVVLPDSSYVDLRPNSELSYYKQWPASRREVFLHGEGFFEVVKNHRRPFYVYSSGIVTKVLGTSFTVSDTDTKSVKVAVHTGRVAVYEHSEEEISTAQLAAGGVVLTPNEKVEFFAENRHWVTSLVEIPKVLPSVDKSAEFVFSDTPVSEILEKIELAYNIDVVTADEQSDACTFTGDVSAMELYDMLNVICKTTGNQFEVKGTKILITGTGCE